MLKLISPSWFCSRLSTLTAPWLIFRLIKRIIKATLHGNKVNSYRQGEAVNGCEAHDHQEKKYLGHVGSGLSDC